MALLIVNPGTPDSWEMRLGVGEHILGSGKENQLVLDHPSVGVTHCSLAADGEQLRLRDLNSGVGTFVEGERVDDAVLSSGTIFQVGEVVLQFQAHTHPEPQPQPPDLSSAPVSAQNCKYHPHVPAGHHCQKCNLNFCDLCVQTRPGKAIRICRRCGSPCRQLESVRVPRAAKPSFFKVLPSTWVYPFKGSGPILLLLGGVLFVLLGWMPLLGFLITGYLFNYAKQIVATSACGKPEPPDWPEFTDWFETFLVPYFHLFALTILAFGPAIILLIFMPEQDWKRLAGMIVALLFGAFLAPMGMLALAQFDTVAALNPVALVWSILRIPGHYLIAAIAFLLAVGVGMFSETLISLVIPIPLLPYVLSGFLSLYLFAVAMRIVGLLYWCKKEEIGWFTRS